MVQINQRRLKTPASHQFLLIKQKPRSTHLYTFIREGKKRTASVTLMPAPDAAEKPFVVVGRSILTGITVEELSPSLNFAQGRDVMDRGVAIIDVSPHSQARRLGFRENDLILRINNQPIRTLKDFKTRVSEGIKDLHIRRGDNTIRLVVG